MSKRLRVSDKNFVNKPDWGVLEEKWLQNYEVNSEKSLSGFVLNSTHKIIENDKSLESHYQRVLEVGSGLMAHFGYVRHHFDEYIASDHDAKVIELLKRRTFDERVSFLKLDGAKLPFDNDSVDRLIATHVLEHVSNPTQVLEEWARVVRPGGVISLILPCDPGFSWRLGRSFGPRRRAIQIGLPYDYYMALEHKNSIHNLINILEFHFPIRNEKWWPLKFKSVDLNLIYGVNCYI